MLSRRRRPHLVDKVLEPSFRFTAFVGWDDTIKIMIVIFLTGIILASVAAFLTVRRYLKV